MKKGIILIIVLLCTFTAQGQGVKFDKSSSWQEVVHKARAENKYIFVDFFATWCAPCKMMDKVFTDPEVGRFFDKNFIGIKLQFDTTGKESDSVRAWFPVAKKFNEQYAKAFPTFLIFSPAGKLVDKWEAAITDPSLFITKIEPMLNPENQYYTLLDRYKNGDRSNTLIKKLVPAALRLKDNETIRATHEQFADLISIPYEKDQLIALYVGITSSNSKGFKILLNDMDSISKVLEDEGRVQSVIRDHLYFEAYEAYVSGRKGNVNWDAMSVFLNGKAPEFTKQIIMTMKFGIAHDDENWEEFGKFKMDYFDAYAHTFDHNQRFFMNNELWEIFKKCSNKQTLLRAAKWSKYTLEHVYGEDNGIVADTYANLLYKAGEKKEAIEIQKRALELIRKDAKENPNPYVATLNKMKLGIPTWIVDSGDTSHRP